VAAWTHRAAAGLTSAELLHVDETGLRVAGRGHWLHVASSARFTALFCHHRRGTEAIDAARGRRHGVQVVRPDDELARTEPTTATDEWDNEAR